MRALVFGVPPEPFEVTDDANTLTRNLAHSPVSLRDVPDPQPLHDDWVVARPRLTGICGSDSKQILLDFGEGDTDNAMAAFCSFPQVMGHEVVADVVALGPNARGLEIGQRVVLNPWLSCGPRGIEPRCPACETGDYSGSCTRSPGIRLHRPVGSSSTGLAPSGCVRSRCCARCTHRWRSRLWRASTPRRSWHAASARTRCWRTNPA
jgi:threonine dehydrogenase-like Zn-dependent dehydrogenase